VLTDGLASLNSRNRTTPSKIDYIFFVCKCGIEIGCRDHYSNRNSVLRVAQTVKLDEGKWALARPGPEYSLLIVFIFLKYYLGIFYSKSIS